MDESHMHSRGLETHYKAVIVSEQFTGLNAVKRHQKVYATWEADGAGACPSAAYLHPG
jgi:stress-induced morphogen